jgi:hypothetical protein
MSEISERYAEKLKEHETFLEERRADKERSRKLFEGMHYTNGYVPPKDPLPPYNPISLKELKLLQQLSLEQLKAAGQVSSRSKLRKLIQ